MELHNGSKWDPLRTRNPTVSVSAQRPIRTTFGTVPFGRSHNNWRRSEQWIKRMTSSESKTAANKPADVYKYHTFVMACLTHV